MALPRALIAGVTGIVGNNLARHLIDSGGWEVVGISRNPPLGMSQVRPIAVDLRDREATAQALAAVRPTHVFYATWTRNATEAENIRVNGAMIRNVLDAVGPGGTVKHAALVTGTKHYLGPFEIYARNKPVTPFREDQPRLDVDNFYYTQEDVLFEAAAAHGFGWSVHRPHTIVGHAIGNAMNIAATLGVYASICRATGKPFLFPGSPGQYAALADVTDARILARHLAWAATTPAARDEAFNVANGDVFRWERMWGVIAGYFGLTPAPYPGRPTPLEEQMADASPLWDAIVRDHGLQPNPLDRLASFWHTDADLGRPMECVNDLSKGRRLGFLDYQETERSFFDAFDRLRAERIIP